MILVDFNNVVIAGYMAQQKTMSLELNLIRHIVLNSLRSYNVKFRDQYGEMVLCVDSPSWRKQVFPYYKAQRKRIREQSQINWSQLLNFLNQVTEEVREYFPYSVMKVEGAEADDIIGGMVWSTKPEMIVETRIAKQDNYYRSAELLIVSPDHDFVQLHSAFVKQYDPRQAKFITVNDPKRALKVHILKGDKGDGVPNFLSEDNCLVVGKRQKPLRQTAINRYVEMLPLEFCENEQQLKQYYRNEMLIDLSKTPSNIKQRLTDTWLNRTTVGRDKLFNYMFTCGLKDLIEHINEF